jgi:prephenate dehydrogenase
VELRTVAIAGLGLIGGSLARDLAAAGVTVIGYDADPATTREALAAGVIEATLGPDLAGVEDADALVIAVPVARAVELLGVAAPRVRGLRLVTDAGSTKYKITTTAARHGLAHNFIGAHPLTGDHRSGWTASRPGLFRGARVFRTPIPSAGPEALATARTLWAGVGARVEEIDAAAHDRSMGWISHLPQVTSTALALVLAAEGIELDDLGPGGRDLTRLASSSPTLWSEIVLENRAALSAAIRSLEERLSRFRGALDGMDEGSIQEIFVAGNHWSRGQGR